VNQSPRRENWFAVSLLRKSSKSASADSAAAGGLESPMVTTNYLSNNLITSLCPFSLTRAIGDHFISKESTISFLSFSLSPDKFQVKALAMKQPSALPERIAKPPRRRRGFRLALTIAILGIVASIAFTAYCLSAARRELRHAIAEADRLDPGWRFEDLEAQRRLPPPAENSALQVVAAHSLLPPQWTVRTPVEQGKDPTDVTDVLKDLRPEKRLDEQQSLQLRQDLVRVGPALDQARKLADMPNGRYAVAWSADIISTPSPYWDALESIMSMLTLDALLHIQEERPDSALTSARALLNVGRSVGDEPFVHLLKRNYCRRQVAESIERTLAQGQPSAEALAMMQSAMEQEDAVPLLLLHFRGERALWHVFLTRVERGQNRLWELSCVPNRGYEAKLEIWLGRPNALQVHARFLRGMNEAVEIAKLPLEQQFPRYRAWRNRWGYVDHVGDGLSLTGCKENYFLSVHAQMRSATAALAAERYRHEHGDWPHGMAELVPDYLAAVPLDPFDANPLRFRRTEHGAIIYSIGTDGHDDGGDASPGSDGHTPRDIVFTLWNVDQRRQKP
jgi:hypothetical protein